MKKNASCILLFFVTAIVFSQSNIDFTQIEHYSSRILENDYYRNQDLQYVTLYKTDKTELDFDFVPDLIKGNTSYPTTYRFDPFNHNKKWSK